MPLDRERGQGVGEEEGEMMVDIDCYDTRECNEDCDNCKIMEWEPGCGNCVHFEKCKRLLGIETNNPMCDFIPSRYRAKEERHENP